MIAWLQNMLYFMVLPHHLLQQPEKDKIHPILQKNKKISIQGPTVKRIAGTKTLVLLMK